MERTDAPARTRRKGQESFDWRDPGEWVQSGDLAVFFALHAFLADPDDPDRMHVVVARYGPNAEVPVHYHDVDYCSIVVEGSIEVTRHQHEVGSVRIVRAGTAYGPMKAGPEGCTVIEVLQGFGRAHYIGDESARSL